METLNSSNEFDNNIPKVIDHWDTLKINEPYAVVWEVNNEIKWYIGFAVTILSNQLTKFEHLDRVNEKDSLWHYPYSVDIHETDNMQILPIEVIGEWNYTDPNKPLFEVKNCEQVNICFRNSV